MSDVKKSLQNLDFALAPLLSSVRTSFANVNGVVQNWMDFMGLFDKFLKEVEAENKRLEEAITKKDVEIQDLRKKLDAKSKESNIPVKTTKTAQSS